MILRKEKIISSPFERKPRTRSRISSCLSFSCISTSKKPELKLPPKPQPRKNTNQKFRRFSCDAAIINIFKYKNGVCPGARSISISSSSSIQKVSTKMMMDMRSRMSHQVQSTLPIMFRNCSSMHDLMLDQQIKIHNESIPPDVTQQQDTISDG